MSNDDRSRTGLAGGPEIISDELISGAGNLLAFLVDADNASASVVKELLEEAAKYGTVIIRRVYGDWTSPNLAPWKKVLQDHALTPIQQFANASGKNATDSALIIDAMDILHGKVVGGFCIVSSDSDYTRLATRIREAGLFVIGMGRANTVAAFKNACNVFVSVENLSSSHVVHAEKETLSVAHPEPKGVKKKEPPQPTLPAQRPIVDAIPTLRKAFETVVREDGRAHLAEVGTALLKLDPAFDSRTFGYTRLVSLVESLSEVFIVERVTERGPSTIYIRLKE
jgi:hypothetical protein